MILVSMTQYVDNEGSEMEGYVEVGIGDRKAFIKHGTGEVINRDNINNLESKKAFKKALELALGIV